MIHVTFPSQPIKLLHRSKSTREQKNICPFFFDKHLLVGGWTTPLKDMQPSTLCSSSPRFGVKIPKKKLWVATTQTTRFYGVMTPHETQPNKNMRLLANQGFPPNPKKNDVGLGPSVPRADGTVAATLQLIGPNCCRYQIWSSRKFIRPILVAAWVCRPMRLGILKEW